MRKIVAIGASSLVLTIASLGIAQQPTPTASAPSAEDPIVPSSFVPVPVSLSRLGRPVRIRFEGKGLTFYLQTGVTEGVASRRRAAVPQKVYTRLCVAPCEITIAAGHYQFSASRSPEQMELAREDMSIDLQEDTTLYGGLVDKSKTRLGLSIASGAGLAAGIGLIVAGAEGGSEKASPTIGLGVVISVFSALGLVTGLFYPDGTYVALSPAPVRPATNRDDELSSRSLIPAGAVISGAF